MHCLNKALPALSFCISLWDNLSFYKLGNCARSLGNLEGMLVTLLIADRSDRCDHRLPAQLQLRRRQEIVDRGTWRLQ